MVIIVIVKVQRLFIFLLVFYFFEIEKVEKRVFFFMLKICKYFVFGVDFQLNEDFYRNGRNYTFCFRIRCLLGYIVLFWIFIILAKVSLKSRDLSWCCRSLSIVREMCFFVFLLGKDLKMRCLYFWRFIFCVKLGLYCKKFFC